LFGFENGKYSGFEKRLDFKRCSYLGWKITNDRQKFSLLEGGAGEQLGREKIIRMLPE
jgi:hypothetical protein